MERLWKNEGATRRKRFDRFKPRNRLNKPNLFATGCHRLPPKSHGKEGVDGSSPSESLHEAWKWALLVLPIDEPRGHETDTSAVRATHRAVHPEGGIDPGLPAHR